jgi:hypothetical protein
MLATVGGTELPRLHPVAVGFVDERLLVFMIERSPKTRDLRDDGRYAFHAHLDPSVPHEFAIRGHARIVTDQDLRAHATAVWPFDVAGHTLYELGVEHALLGERDSTHDWPPRYTTWHAPAAPAAATTDR